MFSLTLLNLVISCLILFFAHISANYFTEKNNYKFYYLIYFGLIFLLLNNFSTLSSKLIISILSYSLAVSTEVDIRAMVIPQLVTLSSQILAPIIFFIIKWPVTPLNSLISGVAAWSVLWIISFIFQKIKGEEGIGLGDADLLAMIAAYSGFIASMRIFFIGAILGTIWILSSYIVTRKKIKKIPFGPFLALATCIHFINPIFFTRLLGW